MPPNFLFLRPICDSLLGLTFETHVSRLQLRLPFATPLATHISNSCSRLLSRLTLTAPDCAPTATRYFLSRLPLCDSTTDGRTVLTPQCHLPSVPTLTLTKRNKIFLEPSP